MMIFTGCGGEPQHTEDPPDELEIDFARRGLIDCSERTDTGYVDGTPFSITVVTVDGKPLERDTANAYYVMQQAAEANGVSIAVVSGFRTMSEQEYFYDCYVNCNCNNCNLAARPGFSNHQSGHALDLNTSSPGVLDWLDRNGASFGFERTVPSEAWHWEWWGGGPGGGPCASQACEPLPAEGGVIDEGSGCFAAYGPPQFWRAVEGAGHDGSLLWTNAFESDEPSNWARWELLLSARGDYQVEVFLEPEYAIHQETRYELRHSGVQTAVVLDQSASSGWTPLGRFSFAEGGDQWVSVEDNVLGPVASGQRIAVDALRIVPVAAMGEDPVTPRDPRRGEVTLRASPDPERTRTPATLDLGEASTEGASAGKPGAPSPSAAGVVDGGCSDVMLPPPAQRRTAWGLLGLGLVLVVRWRARGLPRYLRQRGRSDT